MKIVVTGASGFIGKSLVPKLLAQGHSVRAVSRRDATTAGAEWRQMQDMTDPVDWHPIVDGFDIVIHLAGIADQQRPGEFTKANSVATGDLAKACKAQGIKRLIFMSSIAAQAGSACAEIITEKTSARPDTDYGRSKRAAEEAVREAGVDYTILRPVIVYGPNPKANVRLLMRLAALPIPLPFKSFKNRRSMLSIDNLASAVMFCIDAERTRNQTYLVADPEPIAFARIVAVLRIALGRRPGLFAMPPKLLELTLKAARRSAIWDRIGGSLVASPAKLIQAGWCPSETTEQGLTIMVQFDTQHHGPERK